MYFMALWEDYRVLSVIYILKIVIRIICIVVPIILIVSLVIGLMNHVMKGENNGFGDVTKSMVNKIISAIVVFLVPTIINVVINIIGFNGVSTIYNNANREYIDQRKYEMGLLKEEKYKEILDLQMKAYNEMVKKNEESSSSGSGKPSTGASNQVTGSNTILLIAGHSYSPYCSGNPSDCRGVYSGSGYAEETETRKFVQLLKKKLIASGYSSDRIVIVNEYLGENFSDPSTTRSLYKEYRNGNSSLNNLNGSYAIEIHFNACGGCSAAGTQVEVSNSSGRIQISSDIMNTITSITGNRNRGFHEQQLATVNFFAKKGIPFTYLEAEFYDNASAMQNFWNKSDQIASKMASIIKSYYP